LPVVALVVFGLLSFWVYTVLRVYGELRALLRQLEPDSTPRDGWMVALSVLALLASAILVATWIIDGLVLGVPATEPGLLLRVRISCGLFWFGLAAFLLWFVRAIEAHELRAAPAEAADAGVERRERSLAQVALFLVVAIAAVATPALATSAWAQGWGLEHAMPMLVGVFLAALLVHVWGTWLVLHLWRSHLADGASRPVPAATDSPVASKSAPTADAGAGADAAGAPPPSQLAAIMLTDMVGYSRGMERDEQAAFRKLQLHNGIVRRNLAAHRGREIKTIGDAFLVLFASANDAVECALSIQRSFDEHNGGRAEEDWIRIRIGVHLGDVIITENDVFGDGVNVAARIEPLAEAGGVCISDAVYASVRKRLSVNVERIDDAGIKLKNIEVLPALYRLRMP
jgi:class 3 adenylate cyclase